METGQGRTKPAAVVVAAAAAVICLVTRARNRCGSLLYVSWCPREMNVTNGRPRKSGSGRGQPCCRLGRSVVERWATPGHSEMSPLNTAVVERCFRSGHHRNSASTAHWRPIRVALEASHSQKSMQGSASHSTYYRPFRAGAFSGNPLHYCSGDEYSSALKIKHSSTIQNSQPK